MLKMTYKRESHEIMKPLNLLSLMKDCSMERKVEGGNGLSYTVLPSNRSVLLLEKLLNYFLPI